MTTPIFAPQATLLDHVVRAIREQRTLEVRDKQLCFSNYNGSIFKDEDSFASIFQALQQIKPAARGIRDLWRDLSVYSAGLASDSRIEQIYQLATQKIASSEVSSLLKKQKAYEPCAAFCQFLDSNHIIDLKDFKNRWQIMVSWSPQHRYTVFYLTQDNRIEKRIFVLSSLTEIYWFVKSRKIELIESFFSSLSGLMYIENRVDLQQIGVGKTGLVGYETLFWNYQIDLEGVVTVFLRYFDLEALERGVCSERFELLKIDQMTEENVRSSILRLQEDYFQKLRRLLNQKEEERRLALQYFCTVQQQEPTLADFSQNPDCLIVVLNPLSTSPETLWFLDHFGQMTHISYHPDRTLTLDASEIKRTRTRRTFFNKLLRRFPYHFIPLLPPIASEHNDRSPALRLRAQLIEENDFLISALNPYCPYRSRCCFIDFCDPFLKESKRYVLEPRLADLLKAVKTIRELKIAHQCLLGFKDGCLARQLQFVSWGEAPFPGKYITVSFHPSYERFSLFARDPLSRVDFYTLEGDTHSFLETCINFSKRLKIRMKFKKQFFKGGGLELKKPSPQDFMNTPGEFDWQSLRFEMSRDVLRAYWIDLEGGTVREKDFSLIGAIDLRSIYTGVEQLQASLVPFIKATSERALKEALKDAGLTHHLQDIGQMKIELFIPRQGEGLPQHRVWLSSYEGSGRFYLSTAWLGRQFLIRTLENACELYRFFDQLRSHQVPCRFQFAFESAQPCHFSEQCEIIFQISQNGESLRALFCFDDYVHASDHFSSKGGLKALEDARKKREELTLYRPSQNAFFKVSHRFQPTEDLVREIVLPDIGRLLDLFLELNFDYPDRSDYIAAEELRDGSELCSPDHLANGLRHLIGCVGERVLFQGVPKDQAARNFFYQGLEKLLCQILVELQSNRHHFSLRKLCLLDLGEAGHYCGGRWMSQAITSLHVFFGCGGQLGSLEEFTVQTIENCALIP